MQGQFPDGALALQQGDPIMASARVVSFHDAPALRGHDEYREPRVHDFYCDISCE